MRIAVPAETQGQETRVAATPETVKRYKGMGAEVVVQTGAGLASGVTDADYEAAGAQTSPRPPRRSRTPTSSSPCAVPRQRARGR